MILDDKKNKGVNGFALLAFAIFIIVMFWVTGNLERKDNELSRKQFEKLVVSEDAKKLRSFRTRTCRQEGLILNSEAKPAKEGRRCICMYRTSMKSRSIWISVM